MRRFRRVGSFSAPIDPVSLSIQRMRRSRFMLIQCSASSLFVVQVLFSMYTCLKASQHEKSGKKNTPLESLEHRPPRCLPVGHSPVQHIQSIPSSSKMATRWPELVGGTLKQGLGVPLCQWAGTSMCAPSGAGPPHTTPARPTAIRDCTPKTSPPRKAQSLVTKNLSGEPLSTGTEPGVT